MSDADLLHGLPAPATPNLLFGESIPEVLAPTDLLFDTPAPSSPNLVFGGGPVDPSLSPEVTISGSFAPLTVSSSAIYSTNTARPVVSSRSTTHQEASAAPAGTAVGQQGTKASPSSWGAFWQRATGLQPGVEHRLPDTFAPTPVAIRSRQQDGAREHSSADVVSHEASRQVRELLASAFEAAAAVRRSTDLRHQDGDHTKRASKSSRWQPARTLNISLGTDFQPAVPLVLGRSTRYQEGVPPPAGITLLPPLPPINPPTPSTSQLVFCAGADGVTPHLLFRTNYCDPETGGTVIVPVRKVYIVINSAALYRVADNALIPTFGMSLSLDASSWTWGFSAELPMSAQALVEPDGAPVELRAVVNGTEFRLLAESMSRERTFGRASLRVSGRGRNAILDAPYAPVTGYRNTSDRTAAQIAADILTYNGVPIGWNVDFGLTDWLIQAGVFAHQGTHISALNAVAQAAGGYLQPHRTAQTLRVLPLYPSAPWAWGSVVPDFELPADVTTRESIQWTDKPEYNRVYVAGQQTGVRGRVTRAGTAGDLLAQMVVDPLITHADAARQRGITVLSDAGRIASVGLSLPILPETGIIEPGKFVRYVDGATQRLGIVRSTSVSVGASAVDTRQQIVLETHE
jgi:hypothetical protein